VSMLCPTHQGKQGLERHLYVFWGMTDGAVMVQDVIVRKEWVLNAMHNI
jgi:hypothetical protein